MRIHTMSALVLAPLALAACAAMQGEAEEDDADEAKVENTVVLGPGGRVEGRLACPAGGEVEVELENKGPGRAAYVIRTTAGEQLATGALHEASAGIEPKEATTLVIVIEAHDDAGATVEYEVESDTGLDVTWDLSRARRTEGVK